MARPLSFWVLTVMAKHFDDGNGLKIGTTNKAVFEKMLQGLMQLAKVEVLVGFPEDTTQRTADSVEEQGITNASLAYIHDNGAPEQNIPARPFMVPGIEAAKEKITDKLAQTVKTVSQGKGTDVVEKGLIQAGLIAQSAIRAKITEGIPPPLAPATIRSRRQSRQTKSRRESEEQYMHLEGQGIDEDFLQGALGIIPLINTGQLRNAVNFVLRPRANRSK